MIWNIPGHEDAPRTLADEAERARRLAMLDEPHMAPLTTFIRRLRATRPELMIPNVDPLDGGTSAREARTDHRISRCTNSARVARVNVTARRQRCAHLVERANVYRGSRQIALADRGPGQGEASRWDGRRGKLETSS